MARRRASGASSKRHSPRRGRSKRPKTLLRAAERIQLEAIRQEIERAAGRRPPRWNANPEDVRRSVLKLVLTLVELIRQLLERQAIRRMEHGTLTEEETESVGRALMRLHETVLDLCEQFDIAPDELTLDLGPVGKLI